MTTPYHPGRIAQDRKFTMLIHELATMNEDQMQLVIMNALLNRFDPLRSAVLLRGMASDVEAL